MTRHAALQHGFHQLTQPYEKVVVHVPHLLKRATGNALHGHGQAVLVMRIQLRNAVNAFQALQREAFATKAAPAPVADNKCLDNLVALDFDAVFDVFFHAFRDGSRMIKTEFYQQSPAANLPAATATRKRFANQGKPPTRPRSRDKLPPSRSRCACAAWSSGSVFAMRTSSRPDSRWALMVRAARARSR